LRPHRGPDGGGGPFRAAADAGGIREEIVPLRERLLSLLTLQEAAIDFAEEDGIPAITNQQLIERVSEIIGRLEGLLRSYEAGRRFRDGATVVIARRGERGKSRLLNRLAGEERAIVAEVPGTTRDYLHADVSVGGVPVTLIDTAGLRETTDPVEREGVRRSRRIVATADLVSSFWTAAVRRGGGPGGVRRDPSTSRTWSF